MRGEYDARARELRLGLGLQGDVLQDDAIPSLMAKGMSHRTASQQPSHFPFIEFSPFLLAHLFPSCHQPAYDEYSRASLHLTLI